MSEMITKTEAKAYSKCGISPTEKNGNLMYTIPAGFRFPANSLLQNGWYQVTYKAKLVWIKQADCEPATTTPPPPDEEPKPQIFQWRESIGWNEDGSPIFEPWHEGEEKPS